MFDPTKKYRTKAGHEYRNYCTDGNGTYYIHGAYLSLSAGIWNIVQHNHNLICVGHSDFNLVEVSPYDDFKKDEPVLVRQTGTSEWKKRHFSHLDVSGEPRCYKDGKTSWSVDGGTTAWNYCKRPEERDENK